MDKLSFNEIINDREQKTFSKYAFLTSQTRGRESPIKPLENRTDFQRDRDSIIHCKSFRRLMHKTQVFLLPAGEHYRTRLTHTLEVTQVARTIARALRLNEDLVEAAALGHDLGHTPFGHAGERAMRQCFSEDFNHYEQSLRVVEKLEKDGHGLNLTWEVRDAIVNHTGDNTAATLEGAVIRYADRIAYINHDIDDACRAGILDESDIPKDILDTVGRTHGDRINCMVNSVIQASYDSDRISMTEETGQATDALRDFLFANVYTNYTAKKEEVKAVELLLMLFDHYSEHPEELPGVYHDELETESVGRCVCDFISGMTDRYAMSLFNRLFVPDIWHPYDEI